MKYYSSHEFFEEGKKEGLEEGREEGRVEGIEQGEKRTQNSIIKKNVVHGTAIGIYQRVHRQTGRIYP